MNLVFENIEKNLTFSSIEPKLMLKNNAKNLVFDITQPIQLGFPYVFSHILS